MVAHRQGEGEGEGGGGGGGNSCFTGESNLMGGGPTSGGCTGGSERGRGSWWGTSEGWRGLGMR